MKNTYYTPELEEFYLGFECEQYNPDTKDWEKLTIGTIRIQLNESNYYLFYDKEGKKRENALLSDKPLFRVKYLDQEDIKSLGFRVLKIGNSYLSIPSETWYIKEDPKNPKHSYRLVHQPPINKVMIIHRFTSDTDVLTIFEGEVKNKSELKKLLKMLKI